MSPDAMESNKHLDKTITSFSLLEELRSAAEATKETPVFVKGTWNLPKSQFILCYKDGETYKYDSPFTLLPIPQLHIPHSKIAFPNFDEVELKRLSDACQPATHSDSGLRTLDSQEISINIGYDLYELIGHGVRRLLGVPYEAKNFTAELNQLQVYGPGSFLESQPYASTTADAIGTFVLVLPTGHQGGDILVRDGTEEHCLEAAQSNGQPSDSEVSSSSWAAFWKHANYEVKPISVGYKVALTFSLSFSNLPPPVIASRVAPASPALFEALKESLADSTFLPLGGLLGFGLKHEYSFNESKLRNFRSHLKGFDSSMVQVGSLLGLETSVQIFYDGAVYGIGKSSQKRWVMASEIMDIGDSDGWMEENMGEGFPKKPADGIKFVVNRGFSQKTVSPWNKNISTKFELCDIGTEVQRKILEQNIKMWTKEGKRFTQAVDPLNFSEETLNEADITNVSGRVPHPQALVINWITPMRKENPVGAAFWRGHRPGMMTHPFGWVNLVMEIPSYEQRQALRDPLNRNKEPIPPLSDVFPGPVESSDVNTGRTFTEDTPGMTPLMGSIHLSEGCDDFDCSDDTYEGSGSGED
ncbi:hypothetical protein SISSUDRAFT_1061255 [Sistotremastrum suecicum HHB10207 ss-3]|uniref:Uncharacterized protein n=1 Tax=Sistotremastrum suecicum HHB10207 ss-3 TaxID=1314776 RepID=A0A166E8R7_9AGAM|nr:hypothetical protein SISSUDRAFT_1061255 [Sistotremastrum suecicum HHB10207 ss-3]